MSDVLMDGVLRLHAIITCPLSPMKNHGYQIHQISTRRNLGARKRKDCALISELHTKREPNAL